MIGRRILIIDTPASTEDEMLVTSIIVRANDDDGKFKDASMSRTSIDAWNHKQALQKISSGNCDWSVPESLTESEVLQLVGDLTAI